MLHELVAGHAQTLVAELRDADPDGGGLPRFVERELAAYLRCGVLAHGFARPEKPAGDMLIGEVETGTLTVGDTAKLTVDDNRREAIRANHSATHLLHHALKTVLGDHVGQKGSLVAPDRLRFDFTHFSPMTPAQIREVEDLVSAEIRANRDSVIEVLPIDQAKQRGAVAMHGEKYGDKVRVV